MLEIRRVDHRTYDVFFGNQWDDWARVRQGKHNTYVIAGNVKVGHHDLKDLHHILAPNMPINYGQRPEDTIRNCQVLSQLGL